LYIVDIPEWVGRLSSVPYRPEVGSPAFMLLESEWVKGTYAGPVYELDDEGKPKMKTIKTAEKDKEGEWITVDEPVISPGLHRLQIAGLEHEVESRWCLLDRMYDRAIIQFKPRNQMIVEWAKYFTRKGWPTIVAATRTTHVYILEALLSKAVGHSNVRILIGDDSPAERDEAFEWFKATPGAVLITPLVKEGVSINEIRAMIVADHVADYEVARQIIGRAMRPKKGDDNRAHVVWFWDKQHPVLRRGCSRIFNYLERVEGFEFYHPCAGPETVFPDDFGSSVA
jgi:superfamily II DNA or RNA helicase